jgi:hypothetical protein
VELLFLNDGPIPPERLELMERAGEVLQVADEPVAVPPWVLGHTTSGSEGNTRSFLTALALAMRRSGSDRELVYFVEDDYLHRPEAVRCLLEAAAALPGMPYLTLQRGVLWSRPAGVHTVGSQWRVIESTTSTFAVRMAALRRDIWIHRLSFFSGGPSGADRHTNLAMQGIAPYPWPAVRDELAGRASGQRASVGGALKRAALQAAVNVLAIRARLDRHLLAGPEPALAAHLEGELPPGTDWARVAEGARPSGVDVHG